MILESLIGGGLTGLFGSIVTNVCDIWKQAKEREFQLSSKKLDMEMMDKEWSYRQRQAEVEGETTRETSADALMQASYDMDRAKYSEGALQAAPKTAYLLVLVDVVRGLIRPGLTIFLMVMVSNTRSEVRGIIEQAALRQVDAMPLIGAKDALVIYQDIVSMTLYLAATALFWWFGTRYQKQKRA